MPQIELRSKSDVLTVNIEENTFEYLMTSDAPEIRVSAFLDRDWPLVEAAYAELFVSESCPFESKVKKVIPGSRVRTDLKLPCAMKKGEQLTLLVERTPKEAD
jgi:hypothetical protein